MAICVITYDISDDDERNGIRTKIEKYANRIKLSESAYAVAANNSESEIYEWLKNHVGPGDSLYVIAITWPAEGNAGVDMVKLRRWLDPKRAK